MQNLSTLLMCAMMHATPHKVVAQGGGTLLGQDLSGHGKVEQAGLGLGPVFPSAQKPHTGLPPATSLVGRNLNDMVKSGYGENARIISDVIQPASVSPVNSAGYVIFQQNSRSPAARLIITTARCAHTDPVPAQCLIFLTDVPLTTVTNSLA